jgi:hypothetical protein
MGAESTNETGSDLSAPKTAQQTLDEFAEFSRRLLLEVGGLIAQQAHEFSDLTKEQMQRVGELFTKQNDLALGLNERIATLEREIIALKFGRALAEDAERKTLQ